MKAITPATREFRITPSLDRARVDAERAASPDAVPQFKPTVFICRPMKQRERERSWDQMTVTEIRADGSRIVASRQFQQAHEILLACLTAVEEFPEGTPEQYPVTGSVEQKDAYLARIPDVVLLEIADEIRERSAVGEQAGN